MRGIVVTCSFSSQSVWPELCTQGVSVKVKQLKVHASIYITEGE